MKEITLNVVTPEKSIVNNARVEAVVLPGELGQMTVLPGHISMLTNLQLGSFAYRIKNEWKWAYLSGGFAQVYDGKLTVLAETVELSHEIALAEAELDLANITNKIKSMRADHQEYPAISAQRELAEVRLAAARKNQN